MILSAFFFALSYVLVKSMSPSVGMFQIAFFRFLLGGLILWPVLVSGRSSLKGKSTGILVLRGLAGTLAFFCLLKSIPMIPLSNAMVLLYTFPLFATLLSFLLLKERFKKSEIMLILALSRAKERGDACYLILTYSRNFPKLPTEVDTDTTREAFRSALAFFSGFRMR